MKANLKQAREVAGRDPQLSAFEITIAGPELHLSKGGECFARLIPTDRPEQWRMEYFAHREGWEHIHFAGTLEECLDFLAENPHYLFWEG